MNCSVEGRIPGLTRRPTDRTNMRWTRADHAALETFHEGGMPLPAIAAHLGRTYTAVRSKVHRRRLTQVCLSGEQVAARMGVEQRTVYQWIARGWLVATVFGTDRHTMRRVTDDALMAFLSDDRYRFAWDASRITDDGLRTWARALPPSPWMTVAEAAAAWHVARSTVRLWIKHGRVTATKCGGWHVRRAAAGEAGRT
jgi:excisionase family DNA binding protein